MIPDEELEARALAQAEAQDEAVTERKVDLFEPDIAASYVTAFTGPSLGTEEELSGVRVKMHREKSRLIGKVSKNGVPLVLITRDMIKQRLAKGYREYTIGLRTTPCEIPVNQNDASWEDRRRALQVAIWAIENKKDYPLVSEEWNGFDTVIFNSDHSFVWETSSQVITGSDRQATFGVPAIELVQANQAHRGIGQLHPHVQLSWYLDQFTMDKAVAQFATPGRVAYAFLMSAALKLARLPGMTISSTSTFLQ